MREYTEKILRNYSLIQKEFTYERSDWIRLLIKFTILCKFCGNVKFESKIHGIEFASNNGLRNMTLSLFGCHNDVKMFTECPFVRGNMKRMNGALRRKQFTIICNQLTTIVVDFLRAEPEAVEQVTIIKYEKRYSSVLYAGMDFQIEGLNLLQLRNE